MRKQRGQYKRCGRLGYNARLRRWSGKKKKWEKRGRFYRGSTEGSRSSKATRPVNPLAFSTHEERRGERNPYRNRSRADRSEVTSETFFAPVKKKVGRSGGMMRRKDVHGRLQMQKTGRKRRYGGVKRDGLQKDTGRQRDRYKAFKSGKERRYRKGMKDQVRVQNKSSHRLGRREVRVDVRRWRSGRAWTLQMARDLVEHGKVSYVNEDGTRGPVVGSHSQGARVEVGHGRKVDETAWKGIKEDTKGKVEQDEYAMTSVGYMEVDYVTGRRILLRRPEENEVVIPKGMDLSVDVRKTKEKKKNASSNKKGKRNRGNTSVSFFSRGS